jgi:hypothetical protein
LVDMHPGGVIPHAGTTGSQVENVCPQVTNRRLSRRDCPS